MSPTQAERRAITTAALLSSARELFASDGYAATSLEAVAAKAGVTKGAVYHLFDSKRDLFEAVLGLEIASLAESTAEVYRKEPEPWEALRLGSRAFVEACLDPEVQRILLLDSFAALGWERVRKQEALLLESLILGIERAVDAGRISERPAAPLAGILFGAMCELAMSVARSGEQRLAEQEALDELDRIFAALAA